MFVTICKLSKNIQVRLLEYFVSQVMAQTTADLLVIQANTAALLYHKIREIIAYWLALQAHH
jgi:transposase